MFSSLGLFKGITCPRQYECSLPTCIFLHEATAPPTNVHDQLGSAQEYDPFSAGEVLSPPPKRRRLDTPETSKDIEQTVNHAATRRDVDDRRLSDKRHISPAPIATSTARVDGLSRKVLQGGVRPVTKPTPASVARTVSPPPTRDGKPSTAPDGRRPIKAESLTPRSVARAPAVLKTRLAILQKLHEQMQAQNAKLAALKDQREPLVLKEQELITFALDEEEAATKLGENIYRNALAQKVLRIKKMTTDEWVKTVSDWTGTESNKVSQAKERKTVPDEISTGLATLNEQIAVLKHLRTPIEGLEAFGYVTSKPTDKEIASAKAGIAAAAGYETCDRCGTRFQVFPGRDQHGRLTSHGKCRYHWAKPYRAGGSKATRILGQSEAIYPCCNKSQGSEGCSEAATHVFYVKDPKRLASILQFEHTPPKADVRTRQPVSFDCEMGYTTLGMEVIRVTAVTWPENRLLLDILVRPYGEVLNLNTRFSGVTPDAFANAPSHQPASAEDVVTSAEGNAPALRKVSSPAAARDLLFECLSPETPLIGHAIENDLNVCRLIHPFIIDTVLLYPHPRGLPIRYGLRMLSQKYLSRSIQAAGEAGHDSKEDAVATGDLVVKKVAETWGNMRRQGWAFVDGLLTAPDEIQSAEAGGQSMSML
ncbi:RNA exonuclease 3 [Exophiala xenobiotica]|uniref:RNA exonuclease 3 n=1 Tax=Vermiconidia calcicola TaxID=1690605 RepID=A0AAV9PX18_9PEZI|nr:RNA exonuclease 3 [Exophiala xenobiotica]KAK5435074.1 RNA exonuclease 3 [Exophiala xenobiotica]KAK5531299.1 RNA exonuclease 3 [Vermiconidia calcicola]KAK5540636.1 RNA exonuclease 3 [Chaetothyriales sp. CCFEE 6169]